MSEKLIAFNTQKELPEDAQECLQSAVRSALLNVHTCLPGIVESYDGGTQTCEVRPSIKRVFTALGSNALPMCGQVPVVYPGGALTFDIVKGDECLILFSERCIDRWYADGGVQDAPIYRMHDLSDGFAVVGPNSLPNLLASIGAGTELRNRSGTNRVALRDGKVFIGTSSPTAADLNWFQNSAVLGFGVDPFTECPYSMLGVVSMNVLEKA